MLGQQQKALLDALTRQLDTPGGFERDEIETASAALAKKRLRTAQKSWPALADVLGERFEPLFERYAQSTPLTDADPLADARRFLRFVLRQGNLSRELRLALLPLRAQSGWPIRCVLGRAGVSMAIRWWRGRVWHISWGAARPR